MEIKGEDFIKNVQYKQEKNELEDRLFELEAQASSKQTSNNPYENNNPYVSNNNFTYEEEVNKTESELDDILLGANQPSQNQDNKKKYIILGLILSVLFLITIIIFRLLSNESTSDDSFVKAKENIEQDKPLNNNIEQQYQKIVNEKLKSIEEQKTKTEEETKKINESLDLNNIQKEETKIDVPKPSKEELKKAQELKKDIFEIKEQVKKEVKKESPKVVAVAPIVKKEPVKAKVNTTTNKKDIASKPSGIFIQVGAFSKAIDKEYLNTLKSSNLNYTFYKVLVKGTVFTKVLVGPYNSRDEASKDSNNVKNKLKVKSTFILKL